MVLAFANAVLISLCYARFKWYSGALIAGNDIGAENLTTNDAIAHCTALPA